VCCLLELNSVTSTPQWIRLPKQRDVKEGEGEEGERERERALGVRLRYGRRC